MNPFVAAAILIFCFMCCLFVVALLKKDNSIADIGWGIGFILVALFVYQCYSDKRLCQKAVTLMVCLWGIRLSLYLIIRNWGKPEDFRYANWRKEWGAGFVWRSFLQVFMLQGTIMWINLLPVLIVNATHGIQENLQFLYGPGSGLWVIGFGFETVGDWQMYVFKNDPHPHKARIMNRGLWRYTRHPNYFGEALMWWGIFLISVPSGCWYVSLAAPLTISFLLLRVSGVTMLEKKYEGNDEYARYKQNTNAFFPWFPKN